MWMIIKICNCNSIDVGEITVQKNVLNIFYAINGTGKSTIVKAISGQNDPEMMDSLRPFKYRTCRADASKPEVLGIDGIQKVKVFDEDYISQYVFQPDELVKNSFEIFIKTPEYEKHLEDINELLKDTQNIFVQNPELDKLIEDFSAFINGFGKAQMGISKASPLSKGLGDGNKIYNIPQSLTPYQKYLQNDVAGANVKWLKWHFTGNDFFENDEQCPYCATKSSDETKEVILKVSKEFDSKSIEHLNKMIEIFESLKDYFSDSTKQKMDEISKTISGISEEQKNWLLEVKQQAITLREKLLNIKTMNFKTLKDVGQVKNEILSYKVDLSYLDRLDSEFSRKKINGINLVLDRVLQKATDLQAILGKQNFMIRKIILKYSKEINSFLSYAGYKYNILLEEDEQKHHRLKLRHNDMQDTIDKANVHLSFGERNAFALVLFMYDALSSNPNLIILDDPVSSFDGNKKYAILHKLFQEKHSFKDKTVLLFTHEFGTIIDTIYNMPSKINATAKYLENQEGKLIVKEIIKDKIKSFSMILKENIRNSSNKVNQLIYLRRLLEVDGNKGIAWQLLSNIFKDNRETPYILRNGSEEEMTSEEINNASQEIRAYVSDFDYVKDYKEFQDKSALMILYKQANSNYEKLQLYRIIKNEMDIVNVIKKFVNETFHVENDYLFQLNPIEYEIIPQYVIDACDEDVNAMFKGCHSMLPLTIISGTKKEVRLFDMPAAAGLGNQIEDNHSIPILIENIECDFAVRISGDSMEPVILNKSIVLVKNIPNIKVGTIGIFTLNGTTYCKEFHETKLCSINPTGENFEINEYDNLVTQGKIVKIISPDSINDEIKFM